MIVKDMLPVIAPFTFDEITAVETILYIANRVNDPTFHRVSKIIYFADKAHLEKYGRLICGDSYVAMRHGPVPSGVYDILKTMRGDGILDVARYEDDFDVIGRYTVKPLREADPDNFSDSELECLDEAIEAYGTKSFRELTRLSHDKAWEAADENDIIELEHIAAMFEDYDNLLEHLNDLYPDD